jgi:hypothetical protein
MKYQDLKISAKLGLAFSALILAFAISSGVVFTSIQRIDKASIVQPAQPGPGRPGRDDDEPDRWSSRTPCAAM